MHICFIHLGREHLGIQYLSAVLKRDGHKTSLLADPGLFGSTDNVMTNTMLERVFLEWDSFVYRIGNNSIDLIAFSVYSDTYRWACELAKNIKEYVPIPVVFGGIHTTLVPYEVIKNEFVDYAVVGEGETCLSELVSCLEMGGDPSGITNLYYKKGDRVYPPDNISLIEDIEKLPFPDKDIFKPLVSYVDDYMIMTTRGCVSQCSFCCESVLKQLAGPKYFRRRSVRSVIRELSEAKSRYKIKRVMFFDSIFFSDREWLKQFSKEYKDSIGLPYKCIGHVNFFDEEIGGLLKMSGCYCVDFGIETGNEERKKTLLKRPETKEDIERCLSVCDRIKLPYDVDIMFGLPGITEDDYKDVAKMMLSRTYLNRIKCFQLAYYPKTGIVKEAYKQGFLKDEDIKKIRQGDAGSWFHKPFSTYREIYILEKDLIVFFKLFPLLPSSLITYILKKRGYKNLRHIPNIFVMLLQFVNACLKGDYRFYTYIKYYLFHIKRRISRLNEK